MSILREFFWLFAVASGVIYLRADVCNERKEKEARRAIRLDHI